MMSPVPKIEAVTFDVGGTLIEPWPSVGHVYAEVAARHGLRSLSPERLNRNFAAAWRAGKNFQHTREAWAALVDQTFAGLCRPRPSRTFFPDIYARFAQSDAWRIYDDAMPALEDVVGAKAANFQAVLVDRRAGPRIEGQVLSLRDLESLISRL